MKKTQPIPAQKPLELYSQRMKNIFSNWKEKEGVTSESEADNYSVEMSQPENGYKLTDADQSQKSTE